MNSRSIDYRSAIQSQYSKLGAKKQRIADFVLAEPHKVIAMSVQLLAQECCCEQTNIIRFAQLLGYSGYTDFKLAIARQTNSVWADFQDSYDKNNVLHTLAKRHCDTIQKTFLQLDEKALTALIDKLENNVQVLIFGAGSSHLAAEDLNIKLLRLGIKSSCFADLEMSKTFLGYIKDNGILFLFSNSGETGTVLELARLAKQENITVASVTSFSRSKLSDLADILLMTPCSNEPPIRFGVMSARIAQFAVVDALTMLYSMRDCSRSLDYIAKGYHENVE
jgi:DNA-binding MurR/RpiR family transcriptional regulator